MAVVVRDLPKTGRINRRPQHSFHLAHVPFQIQPFLLAPVLPGETLRNLLMQARVVTDPIKNPLIGWWIEYYFFYVKHRDLDARDDLTNMVLDPTWTAAGAGLTDATAVDEHYFCGGGVDWTKLCLKRVTEEYFRNEGEAWDDYKVGTVLPAASINGNSWLDSVVAAASYDPTTSDPEITVGADDKVSASEIEVAMRQWQLMRAKNLTNMSYEDYLATFGVRAPLREDPHVPELVRYEREWSYPTNTVDPTTGSPTSAVSWSIATRADKDRYFAEPGFLFGVTVARPKVYFSRQTGSAAWLMDTAYSWLPAMLQGDPNASLVHVADATGPLGDNTDANGYWADVRDLLMYGDQFCNFALTATDKGLIALPTVGMQKRYPDKTMVDGLFVTATADFVRQDGVVALTVAGSQRDTSATVGTVR